MDGNLLEILQNEVVPALGCTSPTSVAYAVSVARAAIGGTPSSVRVLMDKDGYKNTIAVGIPGTDLKGLGISAALGAVAGDSEAGLEVLHNVTPEDERRARELLPHTRVDIDWDLPGIELYNAAWVKTDQGIGHALVRKTHTNVVLIKANNEVLFATPQDDIASQRDYTKDPIRKYNLHDFYQLVKNEPLSHLDCCKKAIEMNLKLAEAGMDKPIGSGFGYAFSQMPDNLIYRAKALTAAASDARMAGVDLPAMSCATSGNVGIAASLPLWEVAKTFKESEEELLRALALSFLTVIYVKSHIGRLSAICACATAAGLGAAAGTAYLLGGGLSEIEMAINNVIGSTGGVLCDGAKCGCALKLANAIGTAIEGAFLAEQGVSICARDGLVGDNADDSIETIGKIACEGMPAADEVMVRLIVERETKC